MIERLWRFLYNVGAEKKYRLLLITLAYYTSLYFSTSNRTILVFTACYWAGVYFFTKNIYLSTFLVFLATLPFPKGKAWQFILMPRDLIQRYALYGVTYFFPVYISDFFLALLGYIYIRKKFLDSTWQKIEEAMSREKILLFYIFIFFIGWVLFGGITSLFSEVGILSTIQLVRMFVLFGIPFIFDRNEFKRYGVSIYSVIIALLIFESSWTIFQRIHGGPLGKDLEVYLPGSKYGIFSSEDASLLRNTGTFFEPSILGTFLLMQIGSLSPLLFTKKFRYLKTPSSIAICMGMIALIFTGSRALYGVLVLLGLFLMYMWRAVASESFRRIRKKYSWKISIGVASILVIVAPYIVQRMSSITDVFTVYGSASYRIQMIIYSIRIALSNLGRGVGINLSPYYLATGFVGERYVFDPTYPHNLTAQLFAETGLIGVGTFVLFVVCWFRFIRRNFQTNEFFGFGLASLLYLICAQFYPIFLNHTELSSFFFLYAGFAVFWSQYRKYG